MSFFPYPLQRVHKKGFILPLTLIICTIILTVATGISVILAKELYFSRLSRLSQIAYYAADNGLMCATSIDDKYIDPATGIGIFAYSGNPLYDPSQVLQNYNTQHGTSISLNDIRCATSEIFDTLVTGYTVTDFVRSSPAETGKSTTFSMRMDLGDGSFRCATVTVNKTVNYRQIISRGFASCGVAASHPIERAVISTSEVTDILNTTVYVLTSGSSWTVPDNVSSLKIWAIGGGGGGGGSNGSNDKAGSGGGAGGVAYTQVAVTPGQVISYSVGASGSGGVNSQDGNNGGRTTVTLPGPDLEAEGGSKGKYNDNNQSSGGTAQNGTTNVEGGDGAGVTRNNNVGGGGGGAIGNANGTFNVCGGDGGQALDIAGLFAVLATIGTPTTSNGFGGGCSGTTNGMHGTNASGFGSGGGGAGPNGGNGGDGLFGGGGGGASGETSANMSGGNGGSGVIVIQTE